MINKFNIIFGMIFLLLMIASVSAEFNWQQFGNGDTKLLQQQYGSYGVFNSSVSFINNSIGYGFVGHTQPLVVNGYVFIPTTTYLNAYNSNLVLADSIYTGGNIVNQIGTLDFNGDGVNDEIMGVWNVSTNYSMRVYLFNSSTHTFSKTFESNLTNYIDEGAYGIPDLFGLRCGSGNCYSINQVKRGSSLVENFTIYNITGTFEKTLAFSNGTVLNFADNSIKPRYKTSVSWGDFNYDGKNEYMVYTNRFVVIFDFSGTILYYKFTSQNIFDCKIFKGDNTNYYKLAILYSTTTSNMILDSINIVDSSLVWTRSFTGSVDGSVGSMAITTDYNGDLYNDIYLADTWFVTAQGIHRNFYVLNGFNGNTLDSRIFGVVSGSNLYTLVPTASLTIADMDNDGYDDFVFFSPYGDSSVSNITIYSPKLNSFIYTNSFVGGENRDYSCVPADINLDSFLEVVCSKSGLGTRIFINTGLSNQNSVINSVSYDPSLVLSVGENVNAIISATDPEGDSPLTYGVKCFIDDNFTTSSSSTKTCSYNSVGVYNLTVGVRDPYHSDYNYFSQLITVTSTGFICNNNGICESNLGETYSNCPNDCFSNQSQTQQSSETGGSALPTQIVDVNNVNQGLLPEVYFGTLGFLSNTIQPMIILIFMIFFVLIILAIAFIIRQIGTKVSDLSR